MPGGRACCEIRLKNSPCMGYNHRFRVQGNDGRCFGDSPLRATDMTVSGWCIRRSYHNQKMGWTFILRRWLGMTGCAPALKIQSGVF
jgi:hypothetical protein